MTAQAMSARQGQDLQGLGATPASAVPQECAQPSADVVQAVTDALARQTLGDIDGSL